MDKKKIEEYYEKFQTPLMRFSLGLCFNYTEAEDLCQETWMKVVNKFESYDEKKPFNTWLFAICVNTYKDNRKSFYERNQVQFGDNETKNSFFDKLAAAAKDRDELLDLMINVRQLPEKYRNVIALKYFADMPDNEIAKMLRLPAGTVKWRLHKAKQLLSDYMKGEYV